MNIDNFTLIFRLFSIIYVANKNCCVLCIRVPTMLYLLLNNFTYYYSTCRDYKESGLRPFSSFDITIKAFPLTRFKKKMRGCSKPK